MVQTEIKHYGTLCSSFFKIRTFMMGGGYVMIPLIEKEVVERRRWIGREEFTEMRTSAAASPGPVSNHAALLLG